jgi:hypothetical protein
MKNKLLILFFCINTIQIYCQDINKLIVDLNLPKEYNLKLKYYTFLELIEKSIKYKETNRKEEFEFIDLSNWKTKKYQFIERIYDNQNDKNILKTIEYNFENQKLKEKIYTSFERVNRTSTIYFYNNGYLKCIDDDLLSPGKYYFDKNGNKINYINKVKIEKEYKEKINLIFGYYDLPKIDLKKIKIKTQKLNDIRKNISEILKGKDSIKDFEDFTIEDCNNFSNVNNYIKKELKLNIFKNKDIYYCGMTIVDGLNLFELLDDEGAYYSIFEYYDNQNRKSLTIHIISPEKDFETYISYHYNGNIKSICQKEIKNYNENLLGMNAEYTIDGKIIREVNLEKEFKLSEDSLYSIVRNSKICPYMSFYLQYNGRSFHTNYGNIWLIELRCFGNPKYLLINDSTSEIYTGEVEYYSTEEYKKKYGVQDYLDIEKKINKKVIIYNKFLCE